MFETNLFHIVVIVISDWWKIWNALNANKYLGYFSGALIGGITFQYLNRQLFVIISMTITSLVCAFLPFSPSSFLLIIFSIVISFGKGSFDVVQNIWIIELWQKHCNPFLQLAQFLFGLGNIISSIINSQFFYIHNPSDERIQLFKSSAIFAGILLVATILMIYCYKKYKQPQQVQVQNNHSETKLFQSAPKSVNILIICLISLSLGFYLSIEYCYSHYNILYAEHKMNLTLSELGYNWSSRLSSYHSISRAAMTAVGALIALKLSPLKMIIINMAVVIGSHITLYVGGKSRVIFLIANTVLGAGFSTMWGSVLSFTQQYIVFDNLAGTMIVTISYGLKIILMYIFELLTNFNDEMLIYFNLINSLICIILFISVNIIISIYKRNSNNQNN